MATRPLALVLLEACGGSGAAGEDVRVDAPPKPVCEDDDGGGCTCDPECCECDTFGECDEGDEGRDCTCDVDC